MLQNSEQEAEQLLALIVGSSRDTSGRWSIREMNVGFESTNC